MKKILFVLHIPPPVHGSSIVGKSIMDSGCINKSFDCKYLNLLMSRTVDQTGKFQLLKIFRFVKLIVNLILTLLFRRPDLCYFALTTTGSAFFKDTLLVFFIKCFRVKLVYHLHNKGVCVHQQNFFYKMFYHFVFKNASVIVLSKLLYSDIKQFVPESNVYVCANGIAEPIDFISNPNKSSSAKPRILFLSNLIKTKGVYDLLEACSKLLIKGYDFECNFVGAVGDISVEDFDKKVQELNLANNVYYLGKKFGAEKWDVYKSSDIFTLPTYLECFPLVLLEAMCAGLPIVSTFEGGIPEIVQDEITGFLVPQQFADKLADKLEILLVNPTRRLEMGLAGRLRYEKEFTIQSFENRMQKTLSDIVNLRKQ